jgi:hypothetical protein
MNFMHRNLRSVIIYGTFSLLLVLSACDGMTVTPAAGGEGMLLPLSTQMILPCESCDQATLAAALTQEKNNADNQAAATAEIVRANAQATLNSANATLIAAQTQDQNNANIIAAQIAGTAEIVRANAQATLNSAGATQSAAQTQDSIRQTQMAALATTSAESVMLQQNKDALSAGTQTAVVNNIATQTQVAAATSQWYTDQDRQREEQRKGPITLLWMVCIPIFILLLVGFGLWGFWRWQRIQQENQRILEDHVDKLQAPADDVTRHHQDDSSQYLEGNVINNRYHLTTPDDQVGEWVDEVKRKLLRSEEKDEDDSTDN